MKKYHCKIFYFLIVFTLGFSACSIDLSQSAATAAPPTTVLVSTPAADLSTAVSSLPSSTRPVTWAGLNLTGRLVYGRVSSSNDVSALSAETLDLITGEIKTIFTAPEDAWFYYAAVSPDGRQLVISYVAPAESNPSRNQVLYSLPMDGSESARPIITPPTRFDQYTQVEWSPDGKYLYYVYNSTNARPADEIFPSYTIFRMAYPDGQPEAIVYHAFWPRVSPDSTRLVYVTHDPVSGRNALFLANADGSNTQQIKLTGSQVGPIMDAPLFSPDGQSIIFSAPSPVQSHQPNWLETLFGIQVVKAHNLPSDWWSVSINGGEPTRLTQIQSTNLFGSISPDKKHLVSFGADGLFVMDLDGSDLTSLIPDPGGSTVNWIP